MKTRKHKNKNKNPISATRKEKKIKSYFNFFRKPSWQTSSTSGFTMVELIVAMSIFAVFLTIAVGVFVRVIRVQRNLTHRMSVNNNAGLVLEQMTREIRTGYNFSGGGNYINFVNHKGNRINYTFLDSEENGRIVRRQRGGDEKQLTSPDVDIKNLNFTLDRANDDICNPWRIIINMTVGSPRLDKNNDAKLQTTVSSRVLPKDMPNASQEIINSCN